MLAPIFRGELEAIPLINSVWIRGLEDVEETIDKWTQGLSQENFWWVPATDLNPIGGLIKHISGSSQRLLMYAKGETIPETLRVTPAQEMMPSQEASAEVLATFKASFATIKKDLAHFSATDLELIRPVGRAAIPVKVAFILHHLVEHAQHHTGQIIVVNKLLQTH